MKITRLDKVFPAQETPSEAQRIFREHIGNKYNQSPALFASWFLDLGEGAFNELTITDIAILARSLGYPVAFTDTGWTGDRDYIIGDIDWLLQDMKNNPEEYGA